jgi:hypothetical protein
MFPAQGVKDRLPTPKPEVRHATVIFEEIGAPGVFTGEQLKHKVLAQAGKLRTDSRERKSSLRNLSKSHYDQEIQIRRKQELLPLCLSRAMLPPHVKPGLGITF